MNNDAIKTMESINDGALLELLRAHYDGSQKMSPGRIQSAKILLGKKGWTPARIKAEIDKK